MPHAPPTLTWSLDSTASATLSVAKDVVRAATSDNVQPLALIACEKFGATLAMCEETNKKIEDLIIKVAGPTFVRFMSAQIGYSANDSATQLSKSLAGIQFLGLAAAFGSSMSPFEGANALSVMLMASASDKTLLPTVRQLRDLLGVMEHRLNRSGFTELWVGYRLLLFGALNEFRKRLEEVTQYMQYPLMQYPESDGVAKLVEAFRELNRLGDATAITIRAASCAPWVMAFTRWCLGLPPSTYLPDGKALLDQPASRVTLFIDLVAKASAFEITVQRSIGSPVELLKSKASTNVAFGMVTIECFGRLMRQEFRGQTSDEYRAICQALPYALKQCCYLLRPYDGWEGNKLKIPDEYFTEYGTKAFPHESMICNILERFLNSLNSESQQYLPGLNEGHLISDLPLVHLYLGRLAESCTCEDCVLQKQRPGRVSRISNFFKRQSSSMLLSYSRCSKDEFFMKVSHHAAYILALSLFEGSDTLLVDLIDYSSYTIDLPHYLKEISAKIYGILKSGKPAAFHCMDMVSLGHTLVGHKTGDFGEPWVISCFKGQAVYPRVYESRGICQPGYLVLCWAPGLLFFDGEVYDMATGESESVKIDPVSSQPSRPVIEPLNLVPDMRMEWKVVRRDGYLEVYPVCGTSVGFASHILKNLTKALILRGCPHESASALERPDVAASYKGPFLEYEEKHLHPRAGAGSKAVAQIGVIAVDGDAGLRMFAMSYRHIRISGSPLVVIRDDSCLQCCLNLCRRTGAPYLIC